MRKAERDELEAIVRRLIKRFGTHKRLANALGITRSAVSQWRAVPPQQCLALHRITGIPLHELRPDIYPAPDDTGNDEAATAAA